MRMRQTLQKISRSRNFNIYGMNDFVSQFIAQKYPDEIKFDRDTISVTSFDIEVQSDEGFPEPKYATILLLQSLPRITKRMFIALGLWRL